MIIIVANNAPKKLFEDVRPAKKVSVWKILDTIGQEARIEVIKMIEEKVKGFKKLIDE